MKIGFIGLGNMAGTICQGLIKSDFIDGSEVYGYDINSQQLMMFEQDFGIHVCSSEQDVVKNCDYLVMGVKPNVVESVISKIKSVIDQQVIVSIVAGYGNDKYEELCVEQNIEKYNIVEFGKKMPAYLNFSFHIPNKEL